MSLQVPYALALNLLVEALVAAGHRASVTELHTVDGVPDVPVKPVNILKALDVLRQVIQVLQIDDSSGEQFARLTELVEDQSVREDNHEKPSLRDRAAIHAQQKLVRDKASFALQTLCLTVIRMCQFSRLASIAKPIKEVFMLIDDDQSGIISPSEFQDGMRSLVRRHPWCFVPYASGSQPLLCLVCRGLT